MNTTYRVKEQGKIFPDVEDPKTTPKKLKFKITYNYRLQMVRDGQCRYSADAVSDPETCAEIFRGLLNAKGQTDREQIMVLYLDVKNKVLGVNICHVGGTGSALVHPKEVLKPAIVSNASAIILCHNHPSGDVTPSREDKTITKRISLVSGLVGITLYDHIIISADSPGFYSFANSGLIFKYKNSLKDIDAINDFMILK